MAFFVPALHASCLKSGRFNSIALTKPSKEMRILLCPLLCMLVLWTTSCSMFRSSTQTVFIQSEPSGATVRCNNGMKYKTPAAIPVPRNRLFYAEVVHEGYKTECVTSGTHVNATGVLDIIGACFFIIPIIGVAFPGFMSLDSTYFNVDMDPAPDGL